MLAVLMSAGCYTYQPPLAGPPAPGSEVRAQLSTEGMIRMESFFGEPRRTVEGELLEYGDMRVLLLARTVSTSGLGEHPLELTGGPLRQRLVLDPSEVLLWEERQFDRTRTAGLSVAGMAVAGYLLWRAFIFEPGGDSFGLPPGGPEMLRSPRGGR